ncbi:hypothetical protein ACO1O0_007579 [Amphichorda felina]
MCFQITVSTRVLILADTHGKTLGDNWPRPNDNEFDLVIHCGDLTQESKLSEFSATLEVLKSINAPLKLVIAGNHELTLDSPTYQKHLNQAGLKADDPAVLKEYGAVGEARQLLESADGSIKLLDEGTHNFTLPNGASITIYASPWTPRKGGTLEYDEAGWAFQYNRRDPTASSSAAEPGHKFDIATGTDIVVTHGPPHGVLDYVNRERAGCPDLFAAVARARPRLHCFGHIHRAWGAKLVAWRGGLDPARDMPSHFTDIDNERSVVMQKWAGLRPQVLDGSTKMSEELVKFEREGFTDATPPLIMPGEQTMFVNAAVEGDEDVPVQPPMVVNLELPRAEG